MRQIMLVLLLALNACATVAHTTGSMLKGMGDGLNQADNSTASAPVQSAQDPECNQYKQMTVYGVQKTCFVSCEIGGRKEYQCN